MKTKQSAQANAPLPALPVRDRDHIQGRTNAPIKLLEYGDYECPFCGEVYQVVKEIQQRFGKNLCFTFRNFPLVNSHPHSERAAQAAEAAATQERFWGMHDYLFEHQNALEDSDLARYAVALGLDAERLMSEISSGVHAPRVREDIHSGARNGVNGTPTFFINGTRYDGPPEFRELAAHLKLFLDDVG